MHWKLPQCSVKKKVRQAKSMNKVMLILFFDARAAVYQHILSLIIRQINALYYCEVL